LLIASSNGKACANLLSLGNITMAWENIYEKAELLVANSYE
jgi:hypothetical protein